MAEGGEEAGIGEDDEGLLMALALYIHCFLTPAHASLPSILK